LVILRIYDGYSKVTSTFFGFLYFSGQWVDQGQNCERSDDGSDGNVVGFIFTEETHWRPPWMVARLYVNVWDDDVQPRRRNVKVTYKYTESNI
jgi:hypothetical protein